MSGYHVESSGCIQDLGKKLAESDIDPDGFDEAWRPLGVVVAALYRKRLTTRPTVLKAPAPEPVPQPRTVAVPPAAPVPPAGGYSTCSDCGFESMTATATKRHFRRMHGDLMHPDRVAAEKGHQLTAKEAWERSHGVNLPFPGDDAASA